MNWIYAAVATIAVVRWTATSADGAATVLLRRACAGHEVPDAPAYDENFIDAMEAIFRRLSTSSHFGSSTFGSNDSNRVYALGQCLHYLSRIDCELCYAEGRVKLPLCLPSSSGRVFLAGCFFRYDSYDFFQEPTSDPNDSSVCSDSSVADDAQFRRVTTQLVNRLSSTVHTSTDYYEQVNASVTSTTRVYVAAQCWKSLNQTSCELCMGSARNRTLQCLPSSEGQALNTGCFLRYSTDPFFALPPPADSSTARRSHALNFVFSAAAASAAMMCGFIIYRLRKRKRSSSSSSREIYKMISESHLNFKYEELRRATEDFRAENRLGEGGYGVVYKGCLGGDEIAVKRLFFNTNQWVDQFFNEVNLISRIQHKNLVRLLGCSVHGPESLLIYEYVANSSLDRFLFDSSRRKCLDWETRFGILAGTAEGLAYLHEGSDIRIIHRDIKASNVLLDENFKPKIADFGLARYFAEGQSHLSTGIAGTIGYMAPEYITHGQLTEKADIYSYGILVLEVITGKRNTSPVSSTMDSKSLVSLAWDLFASGDLLDMLDADLHGRCPDDDAFKVFRLSLLCTQAYPDLRPTMKKIIEMMNASSVADLPAPRGPPFENLSGMDFCSSTGNFASSSTSAKSYTNILPSTTIHGR